MYRLPLFPLNTVLFPKMPLSLHVFEERYKLMMQRCLSERKPFGVVLIESGAEVEGFGGQTIPYTVGCTAVINHVQTLPMGRLNLTAIGEQRFSVTGLEPGQPYLVGQVENLTLDMTANSALIRTPADRLRLWIERYLSVLEQTERVQFDRAQLPVNNADLAYLAAAILKIPNEEKQALLAENDLLALLRSLRKIYRKEVTILDVMLEASEKEEPLPFSLN
ncbi:MAG: LON peptidase substrate-binding domain-containing protein [Chloroflexota bacterium]|nr:LON peptidase substrate-binding domain-containing protein [Chloroflexota bacterium]